MSDSSVPQVPPFHNSSLLDLLDRPIAFHRIFVDLTGSVTAALMLSQAVYWSRRTRDRDGWFYRTQEEWYEETGMKRPEQETARKHLRATTFWTEDRRGIPARVFFRVDLERLAEQLLGHGQNPQQNHQCAGFQQTSLRQPSTLVSGIPADQSATTQHTSPSESRGLLQRLPDTTAETTGTPPISLAREQAKDPDLHEWAMKGPVYGTHRVCGADHQPGTPCYLPPAANLAPS
jgi:hypothetical protein